MAATQSTLVGEPSVDGRDSDDDGGNVLFKQTVDVLGCPVDGCNFSGPSIHSVYSHCNIVHHGEGGDESMKQKMLAKYFYRFSKDDREQSVTISAEY